jgi:6-pyruvoyltetrahydropterin/6-carboxytetrahydropterin synthase
MVCLTRIERFNAAHKLWVDEWTPEQNLEKFGKCSNHNWHGHNYTLHVTVKGHPDPITGFVVNAKDLSVIIKREVTDHLDHRNLNLDVPFFPKNLQPTSENIVKIIWERLHDHVTDLGGQLFRITLWETENIYVEYYGE